MMTFATILACVGSGAVGGVFLAFSSFVMRALAQLPPAQGIAAMQRINIVVVNPVFLGAFLGTALLWLPLAVGAIVTWLPSRSPWLLAAAAFYTLGTFLSTMLFNVPRNERLAQMDPEGTPALEYWPVYVREWTRWNHLRTVAGLLSAACAALAINA
jgi:uncharacterized membrane protein